MQRDLRRMCLLAGQLFQRTSSPDSRDSVTHQSNERAIPKTYISRRTGLLSLRDQLILPSLSLRSDTCAWTYGVLLWHLHDLDPRKLRVVEIQTFCERQTLCRISIKIDSVVSLLKQPYGIYSEGHGRCHQHDQLHRVRWLLRHLGNNRRRKSVKNTTFLSAIFLYVPHHSIVGMVPIVAVGEAL